MNHMSLITASDGNTSIELADLFEAYADCRTNKRNTMNALSFELDYEQELNNPEEYQAWQEKLINSRTTPEAKEKSKASLVKAKKLIV